MYNRGEGGWEGSKERCREREGCCIETAVVGCIATAVASAGSVTGDSYAVDITIMECVRLPLCLSLYIHPNRGARLLLSRYLVSYNPSLSLYHDVILSRSQIKTALQRCTSASFSLLAHAPSPSLRDRNYFKEKRKKKLCNKNYRSVNF